MKWAVAVIGCAWCLGGTDIFEWYPLEKGNVWVYEHEVRDVSATHPRITRWKTEETIQGLVRTAEGTVVERSVKTVEGKPDNGWISSRGGFDYLIRDSRVYFVGPQYWDRTAKQLEGEFRKELGQERVSPALAFPLEVGNGWRAQGTSEWAWSVVGRGCGESAFCPGSVEAADYHLMTQQAASGGTEHVWFRKGAGITGRWYWHNGTYEEMRVQLVRFQAGTSNVQQD